MLCIISLYFPENYVKTNLKRKLAEDVISSCFLTPGFLYSDFMRILKAKGLCADAVLH